jgi:hypothetical protein
MSTLKLLTQFEYRSFMPRTRKQSVLGGLLIVAFLVMIGVYSDIHFTNPQAIFAAATVGAIGIIMMIAIFHVGRLFNSKYREWWLTLPHSRMLLILSKMIGLTRVGYWIAVISMLASSGVYGMQAWMGTIKPLSTNGLLLLVASYLLFIAVVVPIVVVYGLSLCLMYTGPARWALIPYCIGMFLPLSLLGVIIALEQSDQWLLSWPYVLSYCGWIVVIGWPLAYVLVRLMASRGLRSFGDLRLLSVNASKENPVVKPKMEHTYDYANGKTSGFAALYQLDRSRLRYYESKLLFRIVIGLTIILCGVVGFFGADKPIAVYEFITTMFLFPVLLSVLWMMNRGQIERKTFVWWVGFPGRRSRLILSNIAAVFAVAFRYMLFMVLAFWCGLIIALMSNHVDSGSVLEMVPWQVYSLTLNMVILILCLSLLQLSYWSIQSGLWGILLIPVYWGVISQYSIVNRYFYTESFQGMDQSPMWGSLGWLVLIAIPLSVLCIWIGGRYFHHVLDHDYKKGESLFGKMPLKRASK